MIEVLTEDSGSCTKENYIKFSLIDIQQIFSSIGALVREPSYISLDMLVSISSFQVHVKWFYAYLNRLLCTVTW